MIDFACSRFDIIKFSCGPVVFAAWWGTIDWEGEQGNRNDDSVTCQMCIARDFKPERGFL